MRRALADLFWLHCMVVLSSMLSLGCYSGPNLESNQDRLSVSTEYVSNRMNLAQSSLSILKQRATERITENSGSIGPIDSDREEELAEIMGIGPFEYFVEWSCFGTVRSLWNYHLRIPLPKSLSLETPDRLQQFFSEQRNIFGTSEKTEFVLANTVVMPVGSVSYNYFQQVDGLPVFGSSLVIIVDALGDIVWLSGSVLPDDLASSAEPEIAVGAVASTWNGNANSISLGWMLIQNHRSCKASLVYKVPATMDNDGYEIYVNANTGNEESRVSRINSAEHKEVFYAEGLNVYEELPGLIQYDDICHVSGSAECPSGKCVAGHCINTPYYGTVETIMDGQQVVYDYFLERHQRDSWDNNECCEGAPWCQLFLNCERHSLRLGSDADEMMFPYMSSCQAMWIDKEIDIPTARAQGIFGSGFTCENVIAHETAHGIQNAGTILDSDYDEPNTMAEGFSDVFSELVEHYSTGASADWEIGTGCDESCELPLRSLRDPPSISRLCAGPLSYQPQPDNYSNYRPECGPHWNSTIVSKAGFLMGREPSEGSGANWGIYVTGIGEILAGGPWYAVALSDAYLSGQTTFTQFRNAMYTECAARFTGSNFANCVNSIHAMGFWTSDVEANSPSGWTVEGSVDLARFTVSGVEKRWVFYWDQATDSLLYRSRSCVMYGVCSWSAPTVLESHVDSSPAATSHNGYLWVCFKHETMHQVYCDRISASGSILYGPNPTGTPVMEPSIASFDGSLYLSYRRTVGNALAWKKYGTAWSSEQTVPGLTLTNGEPILASGSEDPISPNNDYLFVVYQRASDSRVAVRRFDKNSNVWGSEVMVGQADQAIIGNGGPAASMFRGRLHVAYRDNYLRMHYLSCAMPCSSATDWTRDVEYEGTAYEDITLDSYAAGDSRLYLWRGPTSGMPLSYRYKVSK